MRSTAFAIITFTVLLTMQPCKDFWALAPAGEADVSFAQMSGTDDCEDGDGCSPFCICSCCCHLVGYQVAAAAFAVAPGAEIASRAILDHQRSHAESFKNMVWQPPKH